MPLSPADLERDLQRLNPAVRFVSERRLGKVLRYFRQSGLRIPLNADLPLWSSKSTLLECDLFPVPAEWPERVLLVTPPEDRGLHHATGADVREAYDRVLTRAARQLNAPDGSAFAALTPAQRREVRYVLHEEKLVFEEPTDAEVGEAYAQIVADLREFEPDALPRWFPLAFSPEARCEAALPSSPAMRAIPESPAAARWLARGHYVRAAAAGSPDALPALVARLGRMFDWSDATKLAWTASLVPLVAASRHSPWPHAMRALYDLQRIAVDFTGPLVAVAPVEAILSLGRKPLRRPLEPVRDAIVLRRLRQVMKHVERSSLGDAARHRVEHLLEEEIHAADRRIRKQYTPIVRGLFDDVGLAPANLPERIGREAAIGELLDRLSANGFLRLGDLRDALARNHLKMNDLTLREFVAGDKLLRIDKRMSEAFFGVYRRGEAYLRGIQRFSGLAFGTPLGRWLTLFVALPFGGAFLAIEAVKHILHAVAGLAAAINRLIDGRPPPEHHGGHHAPAFTPESLAAIGLLGTALLALIHLPRARSIFFQAMRQTGVALRTVLLDVPTAVWKSPIARFLLDNRITRFVGAFILWPTFAALLVMLTVTVVARNLDVAILAGAAAFAATTLTMLTPQGRDLREYVAEYAHETGRRFLADFLPGLAGYIMDVFRVTLGRIERTLYAVDEWFRYREGQSKPSLALKTVLALVWFPIAYVVRFAFFLLIEPQVNPIKHFPVVTVSHKVLIPMVGVIQEALGVSKAVAGGIITGIPGIFGFLVWEFKENWKLYAANRPATLKPVILGHHGETMRRLLRPGFHSGTIPKLRRKLRRKPRDRDEHELLHLREAVERMIERHLLAYWETVPDLATARLVSCRIGGQRIEAVIGVNNQESLISFEHINNTIIGVDRNTDNDSVQYSASIRGLFAVGAADENVEWNEWVRTWTG